MTDLLWVSAARRALGLLDNERLVALAVDATGEGFESPALVELAGSVEADGVEQRRLFDQALRELGVEVPPADVACLRLARKEAGRILRGEITPHEGAHAIWAVAQALRVPRPAELDPFVYAASEWDERPEDGEAFAAGVEAAARDLLHDETTS